MREGMKVLTKFGSAEISEIRSNNNIVVVLDKSGLKIRQTLNDLTVLDQQSNSGTGGPRIESPVTREVDKSQKFLNRKAIESLRFGLVPEAKLTDLTVDFDDLQAWVLSRLPHTNRNRPAISEICGPYGTGKSHTMSVVRQVAQLEGYVTARVEINGKSISLGDPESLLFSLWNSLVAKDLCSSTPLLELYLKAINAGRSAPQIAPRGIDRIYDNYCVIKYLKQSGKLEPFEYKLDALISSSPEFTAAEVTQAIRPYLFESDLYVRKMIGRSVEERPYDFIESLFGHARVAEMAGYKGLVVTIDEFEVQYFDPHWDRVQALLTLLQKYLSGQMAHALFPCSIFIATINQPGHRGDAAVDDLIEACEGEYRELEEFTKNDLYVIAEKIFNLYKDTFDINVAMNAAMVETAYKAVGSDSGRVRAFIKNYLANLDRQYGPPK